MVQKQQYVTIKGTRDGLSFQLDDRCAYDNLIEELKEKLSSQHYHDKEGRITLVKVDSGYRYLQEAEKEEVESIITNGHNLAVEEFTSNVVTIDEAEKLRNEAQTTTLTKVIRSGQVIKLNGDVILIGDINPGGMIMATGSIYILGALRGIAHAGFNGNVGAVVAASLMTPSQIRIADEVLQFKDENEEENEENYMISAYLDDNHVIKFTQLQQLVRTHQHLQKFENDEFQ